MRLQGLINHPFFHHKENVFQGVDVLQWISGNGDDVREFSFFERADAGRLIEQFRCANSGRLDRLEGGESEGDQLGELAGILSVRVNAGVGAEGNFYARGDDFSLEIFSERIDLIEFGLDGRRELAVGNEIFVDK